MSTLYLCLFKVTEFGEIHTLFRLFTKSSGSPTEIKKTGNYCICLAKTHWFQSETQ